VTANEKEEALMMRDAAVQEASSARAHVEALIGKLSEAESRVRESVREKELLRGKLQAAEGTVAEGSRETELLKARLEAVQQELRAVRERRRVQEGA